MTRPRLKDVLAIVRNYDAGETVYLSSFADSWSVGTDFPEGTYVQFVLGQNKRKSVKVALDSLEALITERSKTGKKPARNDSDVSDA